MNIQLWKIATGRMLRSCRVDKNMKLEECGKACGHTKGWLADIERGRNGIYYVDLVRLLNMYDYDVNTFDSKVKEVYADLVRLNFEE